MERGSINLHSWYFYVVKCFDGTLYAGISNNVAKRILDHNRGRGAKCLRSHRKRPVRVVYCERHPDKSSALKREAAFKKLPRSEKLKIIGIGSRA